MKYAKYLFLLILFVLILSSFAAADSHLPVGLLKIQDYNGELAQDILANVTFFIAFLAGLTSILSPCVLPLIPAYFAITFKEKEKITLATTLFFLGFTTVFIIMGLLATLTGKTLITVFKGINWLVPLAGAMLIAFGLIIFLGKGFSGLIFKKKFGNDPIGIVLSGGLFAVGWTACIGPILSGVLIMTSFFQNYVSAALLMFAYALGIFVPLFILSFFYDKIHLEKLSWLHKEVTISKKRNLKTNWPNIIAGALFILLGAVFMIYRGTSIVNGLQFFGLRTYFYLAQNFFLENAGMFNILGMILFGGFFLTLVYFLFKETRRGKK